MTRVWSLVLALLSAQAGFVEDEQLDDIFGALAIQPASYSLWKHDLYSSDVRLEGVVHLLEGLVWAAERGALEREELFALEDHLRASRDVDVSQYTLHVRDELVEQRASDGVVFIATESGTLCYRAPTGLAWFESDMQVLLYTPQALFPVFPMPGEGLSEFVTATTWLWQERDERVGVMTSLGEYGKKVFSFERTGDEISGLLYFTGSLSGKAIAYLVTHYSSRTGRVYRIDRNKQRTVFSRFDWEAIPTARFEPVRVAGHTHMRIFNKGGVRDVSADPRSWPMDVLDLVELPRSSTPRKALGAVLVLVGLCLLVSVVRGKRRQGPHLAKGTRERGHGPMAGESTARIRPDPWAPVRRR